MPIRCCIPALFRTLRFGLSVLFSVLFASICPLSAQTPNQNVEVRNAGGGNKEELVRNSAGQVVETRTVDANGKVRSRSTVDYVPGHYAPNTTTTSYYPDGRSVENSIKVNYDSAANFVSELIEQFDQSGKHVSGHRLLHDPVTGEFRCWKWNQGSQNYDRVVCPAGEESGEKPPPLKPISQQQAVKLLESASATAMAEQKSERMRPMNPVSAQETPKPTQYSIVLPAALVPGKQVSGSIVDNSYYLRLRPDLVVEKFELPLDPGGSAAKLNGWRIEVAGSQPQAANNPFSFTVPGGVSSIAVKIYPEGQPAQVIVKSIPIPRTQPASSKPKSGYVAQAVCVMDDVCPLGGTFDGNATTAFVAFDDKPAKIVAETPEMAFVRVPETVQSGVRQLLFRQANELLAFPVVVVQMQLVYNAVPLDDFELDVKKDEHKLIFAGVISVQSLPDESWIPGMFPKSNMEWARRFVPGFEVPHENHAQREEREMMEKMERQQRGEKAPANEKEEKLGYIMFLLKNDTPDIGTWRDSPGQAFALPLNPESFSQGDYRYKFVIDGVGGGTAKWDAALIPFVAPAQGQKFILPGSDVTK